MEAGELYGMKIVIPGGSGQVGTLLAQSLARDGQEVVILSRKPTPEARWQVVAWDAETLGDWTRELDGADVVINLAGRSVNCRSTPENRRAILESRTHSTRVVGQAIAAAQRPPAVWLQASSATIYTHLGDKPHDETTGVISGDEPNLPPTWKFSVDVVKAWEQALLDANTPATRKIAVRTSLVMSPDQGGVFDVLLGLVRKGLGGKNGNGKQYVSWMHEQDFTRAIKFLIERRDIFGPVNFAAPHPLPNAEFMHDLQRAWGIGFGLPATEWMLEIGAVFLKTETELILKSRRVFPGRLISAGFAFDFPTWPEAAADLCRKSRERAAQK